jgi:hypothetical protein
MPKSVRTMASSGTYAYLIHVHVDDGSNKWLAGEETNFDEPRHKQLPSAPSPLYMSLRVE